MIIVNASHLRESPRPKFLKIWKELEPRVHRWMIKKTKTKNNLTQPIKLITSYTEVNVTKQSKVLECWNWGQHFDFLHKTLVAFKQNCGCVTVRKCVGFVGEVEVVFKHPGNHTVTPGWSGWMVVFMAVAISELFCVTAQRLGKLGRNGEKSNRWDGGTVSCVITLWRTGFAVLFVTVRRNFNVGKRTWF